MGVLAWIFSIEFECLTIAKWHNGYCEERLLNAPCPRISLLNISPEIRNFGKKFKNCKKQTDETGEDVLASLYRIIIISRYSATKGLLLLSIIPKCHSKNIHLKNVEYLARQCSNNNLKTEGKHSPRTNLCQTTGESTRSTVNINIVIIINIMSFTYISTTSFPTMLFFCRAICNSD